jgi:hypothetical protein
LEPPNPRLLNREFIELIRSGSANRRGDRGERGRGRERGLGLGVSKRTGEEKVREVSPLSANLACVKQMGARGRLGCERREEV